MQVIMKATGQLTNVPDGYARNYLLPKGLASAATPEGIKEYEQNKVKIDAALAQRRSEFQALAKQLNNLSITVSAKASSQGKLFSAIHSDQVLQAFEQAGIKLSVEMLKLPVIKQVGTSTIKVYFPDQPSCQVQLIVQAA